jgi:4-hydroxyphenylacetate 3-monooxygenase
MARQATPWVQGAVLPNLEAASAYHVLAPTVYPIIKNLIEQSVTSGLISLNSSARDFHNPTLRPYLDKYLRGSGGYDAEHRVKLLKLLWDAIGTEFGARHELYEVNFAGSSEEIRLIALHIAQATGLTERMHDLVHTCMAEYDLQGWTVPDLINPHDVSWLPKP